MSAWAIWLVGALGVAGIEIFSGDLFLIMIAVGAGAAGLTALFGGAAWVQIVVFAVVSILMVATVRPIAKRALGRNLPDVADGAASFIGRIGQVSAPIDAHGGRIKIGEDEWSAVAMLPHEQYAVGSSVRLVEIRGAHAVVRALEDFEL